LIEDLGKFGLKSALVETKAVGVVTIAEVSLLISGLALEAS
jgi:hypothetical protein